MAAQPALVICNWPSAQTVWLTSEGMTGYQPHVINTETHLYISAKEQADGQCQFAMCLVPSNLTESSFRGNSCLQ